MTLNELVEKLWRSVQPGDTAIVQRDSEGAKYSNKGKCLHYLAEAIQKFDNKSLSLYAQWIQRYEEKNNLQKYGGLTRYAIAGMSALLAHVPFALSFGVETIVQNQAAQNTLPATGIFMILYSGSVLLPTWWRARKEFYHQQEYNEEIEKEIVKDKTSIIHELQNVVSIGDKIQFDLQEERDIRESIEQKIFPYDFVEKYARNMGEKLRLPFLLTAFGFVGKAGFNIYEGIKNKDGRLFLDTFESLQYAVGFFLTASALYFPDANPRVYTRKLISFI